MCGIAGIAVADGEARPTERTLRAMCDTLVHRGPDEEGLLVDGGVALGIRRLSIIDLEGGHQPLHNEDRTVRVIFNGEIYNYRELRRELEGLGHRFHSATDGEVIPHLWEEYGCDFVHHLNGMFAIALNDTIRRCFLLVRDRLGIKPLYYHLGRRRLVFGSEIKALLASGLVPRELDIDSLGQFLAWEYVPSPHTLLRSVRKLEPGGMLDLDLDTFESREWRWWDVPHAGAVGSQATGADISHSEADWGEAVDGAVREAVHRRLVADVPLGAFLSGGVDSSLIVADMGRTTAFSIGFREQGYSEIEWSRRVARHLDVDHRVAILEREMVDEFDHLMHFMDDPIGDFSIFPTYLISRHARSEVTVALSGDGGDELFGGYETYVAQERARLWRRLPAWLRHGVVERLAGRLRPRPQKKGSINKLRRFVEGLGHPEALAHARWRLFVGEALQRELFTADAYGALESGVEDHISSLFEAAGVRSEVDKGLYVDMRSYLSDNCLVKVDRMSMACSLEVRVPFLDHEVVELAFQIPSILKVSGGSTKPLLKSVAARHVPRECVYRPKEGFSMPMKHWLGAEGRPLMEGLLHPDRLRSEGVFRPDTVQRLKQEHLTGRENHSHVLWSLMVFQDWRERWAV